MKTFDVAIIGSGFAGSILARVLKLRGLDVVLLEKSRHPRFALGESTTPLANLALERLARSSATGLDDLHQLAAYGRWSRHLPHLRRGLKRGFTFLRHHSGEPYRNNDLNDHRLLVAASPDDAIADSHWLREDVDHHLVQQAVDAGVVYRELTGVEGLTTAADHLVLNTRGPSGRQAVQARYVVDGSGAAGVVSRCLADDTEPTTPIEPPPHAELLYSHVEGLRPFEDVLDDGTSWAPGPYPDEQAAVHHLLDEGWIYVLPFDGDPRERLVSVGAVLYEPVGTVDDSPQHRWQLLLDRYPTLKAQFAGCRPARPWQAVKQLAYRRPRAAGERWFLLPHTFAFFDPMFSTGMAWSLLAVERLADLLGDAVANEAVDGTAYADLLHREADQLHRLIASARTARCDFDLFQHVAMLYFATVSHEELRQRLIDLPSEGSSHCWQGFLGADDPHLVELFETTPRRLAAGQREGLRSWLRTSLQPYDAIGLDIATRHNLFPVDLDVLLDRAHLLGLSRQELEASLPRLRGEV